MKLFLIFFLGALAGALTYRRLPPPEGTVKVRWVPHAPFGYAKVTCDYRADLNYMECK